MQDKSKDIRNEILKSHAKIRLIKGKPGVGKTYFGCEIAKHELVSVNLKSYQSVLFLTFARNAVAKIRQTYLTQIEEYVPLERDKFLKRFKMRVRIDTFAGFFWWIVDCYGRYSPKGTTKRPWIVGSKKIEQELSPEGHKSYTFEDLQNEAYSTLQVPCVRKLISKIWPIIIIDEFQDVNERLFDIIKLLGDGSRLVFLYGPGQTIYQSLHKFDPEKVILRCKNELSPEEYTLIMPLKEEHRRYIPEIEKMVSDYDKGNIYYLNNWPIRFLEIERKTQSGNPKELETQVGKYVWNMKKYLKSLSLSRTKTSIAVLCSTNLGVSKINHRFKQGSQSFRLNPLRSTLRFNDEVLLAYGRLIVDLLKEHWSIGNNKFEINLETACCYMWALEKSNNVNNTKNPLEWKSFIFELKKKVKGQRKPKDFLRLRNEKRILANNLEKINELLRLKKKKLPNGVPETPFTKEDCQLLSQLSEQFMNYIQPAWKHDDLLDLALAKKLFEKNMRQQILFEKIGIRTETEIMTIHKSKGREFDGVIVVLEDNHKALWKKNSKIPKDELIDLYRVAFSRARSAIAIIAYRDAINEIDPFLRFIFPTSFSPIKN